MDREGHVGGVWLLVGLAMVSFSLSVFVFVFAFVFVCSLRTRSFRWVTIDVDRSY